MSPVRYELGLHIPENDILHCHRRENLKCTKSYDLYMLLRTATETETLLCIEGWCLL
jgi:hypothetical protein